jgi:hypothetical protein
MAILVICLVIAAQAAFYYPEIENKIKIRLTCEGVNFLILIIYFVYLWCSGSYRNFENGSANVNAAAKEKEAELLIHEH